MYIQDEDGNTLYIYGVNKDGVRYGKLSDKPQVGDTIILYGIMQNYVDRYGETIYEMKETELIWQG